MAEENNKNVVSDELDDKVKNQEVKVEKEVISEHELDDASGGNPIRPLSIKSIKKKHECIFDFF